MCTEGCDSKGINAFFLRKDLIKGNFIKQDIAKLYRPPKYGIKINGEFIGHPPSPRKMISLDHC